MMGNALAIDTTDSKLVIVLIKGDNSYSTCIDVGKSGHSSLIITSIEKLLSDCSVNIKDIDTVGVVVGPGSFTGIRIGVSAITAIAFANNCKRVSISSFELISLGRNNVKAAVDAGHNNIYEADCINGNIVSTRFIESSENYNRSELTYSSLFSREESLIRVLSNKIKNNDYVSVFEPYYMRKSQAEREKDEI